MGPPDLPSVSTHQKGVSRKLLLLGTVVGAMSFLSPAYAEVWNFAGPPVITTPVVSTSFTGSEGTVLNVAAGGNAFINPTMNGLLTKTGGGDENGLGLANDPSGEGEITPGSWIAVNIAPINAAVLSFQMGSTTTNASGPADAWQVFEGQTFDAPDILLASCTATGGPGNSCEQVQEIARPADPWLMFTASSGNVLLSELDAVPLPGALWLFGTGLAGLGFVCRRRHSKQVSAL